MTITCGQIRLCLNRPICRTQPNSWYVNSRVPPLFLLSMGVATSTLSLWCYIVNTEHRMVMHTNTEQAVWKKREKPRKARRPRLKSAKKQTCDLECTGFSPIWMSASCYPSTRDVDDPPSDVRAANPTGSPSTWKEGRPLSWYSAMFKEMRGQLGAQHEQRLSFVFEFTDGASHVHRSGL